MVGDLLDVRVDAGLHAVSLVDGQDGDRHAVDVGTDLACGGEADDLLVVFQCDAVDGVDNGLEEVVEVGDLGVLLLEQADEFDGASGGCDAVADHLGLAGDCDLALVGNGFRVGVGALRAGVEARAALGVGALVQLERDDEAVARRVRHLLVDEARPRVAAVGLVQPVAGVHSLLPEDLCRVGRTRLEHGGGLAVGDVGALVAGDVSAADAAQVPLPRLAAEDVVAGQRPTSAS